MMTSSNFLQGLYNSVRDNPYETAGIVAASSLGFVVVGYLANRALPPLAKKVSAYFQKTKTKFLLQPSHCNALSFQYDFNSNYDLNSNGEKSLHSLPAELFSIVISFLKEVDTLRLASASQKCYYLTKAAIDPVNQQVYLPRSLEENLDNLFKSALTEIPSDGIDPDSLAHEDLEPLGWSLSHIDPELGKQFCDHNHFRPYGPLFNPSMRSPQTNQHPENLKKIRTLDDFFQLLRPSLASKEKDRYLKFLPEVIKECSQLSDQEKKLLPDEILIFVNALKNIEENEFINPYGNGKGCAPFPFFKGAILHFFRKHLYDQNSKHLADQLTISKLLLDLINGELFDSDAEKLLERFSKCFEDDLSFLSSLFKVNPDDAPQYAKLYNPLAICLLLLTEHTEEAIKMMKDLPKEIYISHLFLHLVLEALDKKGETAKADLLFEYICQFPLQDLTKSLSEERLSSYFSLKVSELQIDTRWAPLQTERPLILLIHKLRGNQALVQVANDYLKPEDSAQKEMRIRRFGLHKDFMLQLLFNLPDTFWEDIWCTRSILNMVESTPGIGPGTIAAVRLRALWAISKPEQREDLLQKLRMEVEPTIPNNDEGSSKCADN